MTRLVVSLEPDAAACAHRPQRFDPAGQLAALWHVSGSCTSPATCLPSATRLSRPSRTIWAGRQARWRPCACSRWAVGRPCMASSPSPGSLPHGSPPRIGPWSYPPQECAAQLGVAERMQTLSGDLRTVEFGGPYVRCFSAIFSTITRRRPAARSCGSVCGSWRQVGMSSSLSFSRNLVSRRARSRGYLVSCHGTIWSHQEEAKACRLLPILHTRACRRRCMHANPNHRERRPPG